MKSIHVILTLETMKKVFLGDFQGPINRPKNFGSRSRWPITKKLRNRPIMFGFGHCLVWTFTESKCTKHEEDCADFCVLVGKSELYEIQK